jgi:hypothetical protein
MDVLQKNKVAHIEKIDDNKHMTQQNKHDWRELRQYLEGFIDAQVKQDMQDPDFTEELDWTEHKSRKNAVENLRESLTIIFPVELIDIKV